MNAISIHAILLAAATALSLLFISGGANAVPMVVISDVTPSLTEPEYTDKITITTTLILVDAEVSEGDVVLGWFPCTDLMCDPAEYLNMTRVDNETWTISIGPFDEVSATGDPYVKITFFVEVQGHATDGSEDPEFVRSETQNKYFIDGEPHDDDTPADDDQPADDGKDTPLGFGVLIAGVLLMTALIIRIRSRD